MLDKGDTIELGTGGRGGPANDKFVEIDDGKKFAGVAIETGGGGRFGNREADDIRTPPIRDCWVDKGGLVVPKPDMGGKIIGAVVVERWPIVAELIDVAGLDVIWVLGAVPIKLIGKFVGNNVGGDELFDGGELKRGVLLEVNEVDVVDIKLDVDGKVGIKNLVNLVELL